MTNDVRIEEFKIKVAYDEVTGLPRWMTIELGEKFHSPPDGRPAHVVFDEEGRPCEMSWFHENKLHRMDGPARIRINPDTGIIYSEEYRQFGESPISKNIPALIERDPNTGKLLRRSFFTGKTLTPG